jgi:hypothetical protein
MDIPRQGFATWIIIDDAQRGYRSEYEDLWTFLVKDLPHNPAIKVIIAATHTMTTLGSPADISGLPHVFENFCEFDVRQLFQEFCASYAEFHKLGGLLDYGQGIELAQGEH